MGRVVLLAALGVTLQACYLPVLGAEEPVTQTKTGDVTKVDSAAGQVVVARQLMFTVTKATQIVQGDEARPLADVRVGTRVTVDHWREGSTRTAERIVILPTEPKGNHVAEQVARGINSGGTMKIEFPDIPPTFYSLHTGKDVKTQMTVFLPKNYSSENEFPLLIFLNGGDGGFGSSPGVACSLCEGRDFVCGSLPLFKGKPSPMVSSNAKSQPRAQQICDAAKAAGAKATLIVEDVGAHDFPVSAHPAVRSWLRGLVAEVEQSRDFNVKHFGAKGDGAADDTPAIQQAIHAAAATPGGGNVIFPKGTYLLDSTSPSTHPWGFYNLQIESNVMLCGETGAKLLQGPHGRHPMVAGATAVRNSILAFGSDHQLIRFQNRDYNGGFCALQATRAASTKIVLQTASESSKFQPGDYVAIYETTQGDVIPTETGRIAAVNASTGELGLKEPLTRAFQTPSIANVTGLATTNVGVKNLIVEGSEPLTVTEVFGFTAQDCHFINDTSIGGGNVIDYNMNTLNGFRFVRNKFTSVGPGYAVMEMTQRNSRHGLWEGNTVEILQGGMGEYAADIQFIHNEFRLHPNSQTGVGLMIGGKDVVFRGNTVTCGSITAGEGWGCVLVDCAGPGYERYVGNITIADNQFTYEGDGNQCVHLVAHDTSFTGNTVIVKGSAMGVRGEGPPPQSLTIRDNTFKMGTGAGIMIASPGVDGSIITGNTIAGSGTHGIYVASPATPNTGKHVIHGNAVKGYRRELFIDLALHPGTELTGDK